MKINLSKSNNIFLNKILVIYINISERLSVFACLHACKWNSRKMVLNCGEYDIGWDYDRDFDLNNDHYVGKIRTL